MLYRETQTKKAYLANAIGALLVGLFFAYVGLNAASGCGQGGECIRMMDFVGPSTVPPIYLAGQVRQAG